MLEIKANFIPFGGKTQKQEIGKFEIINTGDNPNRPEYGNYIFRYANTESYIYDHKRNEGWESLLYKCLKNYLGE